MPRISRYSKKKEKKNCFYSHDFYSHSDNRFRHFPTDVYLGDDPISAAGEERAARDRVRARKRIGELKKRRKAKERRQRMRHGGEKSAVEPPPPALPRAALNETIMSRLDLSCIMKARRKGFTKAPPVENAYPAKYARFVSTSRWNEKSP